MFGLENQKKKKAAEEFIFDLEKSFKDSRAQKTLKIRLEAQIQKIKEALRSGEDKGEFDKYGLLLHGYTSILKVMARYNAK